MKISLKATLIATAIAAIPYGSHAAGLGAINVLSGLGQPLRAEIELSATAQELQTLSARVAPVDAFRQANVTYTQVMTGLRFSVEPRGKSAVVKVVSERPVNDPFLDLIVEINWSSGRLHRGYTFLLDPVDVGTSQTAVSMGTPTVLAQPLPLAPPSRATELSGEYRVQRGDTLGRIAARHLSGGANLDQMLIALLRKNPSAFDGENINRLRAGAILVIPDEAALRAIEPGQARREVVAQAANFAAYRQRLAGTVAARPAVAESSAARERAGAIEPRVDPAPAQGEPQDRIEVSGTVSDEVERSRTARLQSLEEELAAREKALEEAGSRVSELEKTVRDLQRLVEMRNEAFAQLQQQALAERSGQIPGVVAPPSEPATSAEAPPMAQAPAPAEPVRPAPAPAQTRPAPAAPMPFEEPSFLQTLLDDPLVLAGGGGLLVLLLGYAGLRMRQRRKDEEAAAALSGISEFPSEAQSAFGVKGGQSVDTGSSSVLHSDFSQSGLSAIDADEGVDPVAEADVYMAYGRDAQAEEILLDALKADPTRGAIYLKLLEIYAQRKSLRQFESVATDFYSRTGGAGNEWSKAADMGRKLDPDNPLYSGGAGVSEPVSPVTEPGGLDEEPMLDLAAAPADEAVDEVTETSTATDPGAMQFEMPAAEVPPSTGEAQSGDAAEHGKPKLEDTWAMPDQSESEDAAAPDTIAGSGTAEDYAVLDFDLGMQEEPAAAPEPTAEPTPEQTRTNTSATVINSDVFVADFSEDLEPEQADVTSAGAAGEESGTDAELEATTFNNDLLSFDFDIESPPSAAQGTPEPMDLSGIDLDLEQSGEAGEAEEASPTEAVEPTEESFELGGEELPAEADIVQEVDTKLDLARAYEEMGDQEGARELIEEVLREGNAEQQAAARSLLERLG